MKDNKRTVQHDDTSRKGPTVVKYYEVRHESLVNHNSGFHYSTPSIMNTGVYYPFFTLVR